MILMMSYLIKRATLVWHKYTYIVQYSTMRVHDTNPVDKNIVTHAGMIQVS